MEPHYARAFAGERVALHLSVFDRTFNLSAAPLAGTPPEMIIVLVQDVTRLREETGERQRRDALVATVAHGLRQPLMPLRTALELLEGA